MFPAIASLLAGLGLFFVGLRLLTENLKLLSGRRLRENISVWTRHPALGVLWGGVFITITQSAAAATFILIGMLRAGMMTVRQILPILMGVNMTGGLIVLVLIFDIKLAVFVLLGITGLLYSSDRVGRLHAAAGAAFGVGMLFLGLSTTQAGVAPLADMAWFTSALEWTRLSLMLGFVVGAVLSFLVQSSLAVVILTIAFLQAGVFSLDQAILITYGSKLGSSFLTMALATGLVGQSKQVASFQVAYNFIGVAILVPAFYIERYAGVSFVIGFADSLTASPDMQLAIINLLFNIVPGVLIFPLLDPIVRLLERSYPQTFEEEASQPKYLHDHAGDDPHSALRLIELEQVRLIETLTRCFELMRQDNSTRRVSSLHDAFDTLATTVRDAISDLSNRHQLSPELYEQLNGVLNVQHSLEGANKETLGLEKDLVALRDTDRGARFARAAVDGIDTILLTVLDVARDRSPQDLEFLRQMTSEDGLTRVRKAYLAEETALGSSTRMRLLSAANHCERLIWLFGDLANSFRSLGSHPSRGGNL